MAVAEVEVAELSPPPNRKAGWYPDPEESGRLRFWNKTRWTDEFRDAPAARRNRLIRAARVNRDRAAWQLRHSATAQIPRSLAGCPMVGLGDRGFRCPRHRQRRHWRQ